VSAVAFGYALKDALAAASVDAKPVVWKLALRLLPQAPGRIPVLRQVP